MSTTADVPSFRIEPLEGDADLDGVLAVEAESFTNPWTREMYAWELQNRSVCHVYVVRTPEYGPRTHGRPTGSATPTRTSRASTDW